jgi:IS1 family transposase
LPYHRLSCNTKKSKPDAYVSQAYRTFGIIIYVFNCNILLGVHEIMRSETVKEVLAGLCDIIRISSRNTQTAQPGEMANSWLPRTIVYDDCCHVIKHIIDYYPNFFRATPASTFLYHSSFAINAYHYRNHTDSWCKQHLNPDNNDIVKQFNTQSAEESNSWFKRFTKQFSRFDDEHCSLFLSLMFHIRNCKERNINPFRPNAQTS